MAAPNNAPGMPAQSAKDIPWSELGAQAGAQYQGDGLSILPSGGGAVLRCAAQKLHGEASVEGLWLSSTLPNAGKDRFRVRACTVGRTLVETRADSLLCQNQLQRFTDESLASAGIPHTGAVQVAQKVVRWVRPAVVEEYSVSMDGVRQDFVITQRPDGLGEMRIALEVEGALVEAADYGVRLVLEGSQRKIAYNRLHVEDGAGRVLNARIEVPSVRRMTVVVEDAGAVYPVRIDPTFSDENWISMGTVPGIEGEVRVAVADGSGNLYIGGTFSVNGQTVTNNVAKWDGSRWSALGSGMDGYVQALALSGSDLYVSGQFTRAGGIAATNIARWNASGWSALGAGVNGGDAAVVYALAMLGSNLYVGGNFTTAGGGAATNIAKWNGSGWSALGSGVSGDDFSAVYALAALGSDLYVGGEFTIAGGLPANSIAKWNGSGWSALGLGVDGWINALAVSGNDLYVGGSFYAAAGADNIAYDIARWNGSTWSALGSGVSGSFLSRVAELAVVGSDLFVIVTDSTIAGVPISYFAKWNGSDWLGLGSEIDGEVQALAASGSNLYVSVLPSTTTGCLAKWDGSGWSTLGLGDGLSGGGQDGWVNALAVLGNDLYVGGSFYAAGGLVVNNITKWNGSGWSALGSGVNGSVHALAVVGSDLYVGGQFTTADGVEATNIAKWNGSGWAALGSGVSGSEYSAVLALAVVGSDLYVGGQFSTAGGAAIGGIAKWNGSDWSALGNLAGGIDGGVNTLAVSGSDLYVGIYSPGRILKWNGSTWSSVGGLGSSSSVLALAVSGSDLYIGGRFTTAGGIAATNIAKWNGSDWSALGSGVDAMVRALAVSGGDLYVGGDFKMAGGIAANRIAQWTGSRWSAVGSGVDAMVRALAVSGGDLYVGGDFKMAGGTVSPCLAKARLFGPANAVSSFLDLGDFVARMAGTPGAAYTIEYTQSLSPADWHKVTNITAPSANQGWGVGVFEFRQSVTGGPRRFYRAVYPSY